MADPLSIAASIAGLITITQAALAGVHSLVTVIKEYDGNMIKLLQELAAIEQLLQLLKNALPDYSDRILPGNPAFEPLRLLQTTLQDIEKLKPKDSKRDKALWITLRKDKTLKEFLQQLERHKSTISSLLSVHQVDLLKEGLFGQATLSTKIEDFHDDWYAANTKHERKELQQFYHSDHPYRLFRSAQTLHQEHTGGWFVNSTSFKNWMQSDGSKLWVYGIAGAGKTVLSSLAIRYANQHLQNRKSATVIYFFCDNSIPESQNPKVIIGSLIYQLANSKREALMRLGDLHAKRSSSSQSLQSDQLDELHVIFREIATYFEDVSVIVDGLDECENFKEVTEQLICLAGDNLPTRLLFFSRDEIEIRNTLSSFIPESIAANNDDIKLYVASQIALHTQQPNGDLPVESQDVKDRIRERLALGAQGAFRWVECQIDALRQCANENECEEILDNLPEGLKESYDRILDRINRLPDRYQHYVRKALQWTCNSYEPLTLKALCEVVALKDEGDYIKRPQPIHQRKLLQWCSSFLRHSPSDGLIEIAHYSVKEYLREPKYAPFCVTDENHNRLGQDCLRYLLLKDYLITDLTSPEDHENLWAVRPFRRYAIEFWVSHCTDEHRRFRRKELLHLAEELFQASGDGRFHSFSVESYLSGLQVPPPPPPPPPPPGFRAFSGSYYYSRIRSKVVPASHLSKFLDAQVKVLGVSPLHWSASLWLWELTEPLVRQAKYSIHSMTEFGAPLHCAIDTVSLRGHKRLPKFDGLTFTVQALIECGANVNQKFNIDGKSFMKNELPHMHLSTGIVLLRAGLLCDRAILRRLSESKRQPAHFLTDLFDHVGEGNILEADRQYWQGLKKRLENEEKGFSGLPSGSVVHSDRHEPSADSLLDGSDTRRNEGDTAKAIEAQHISLALLHATKAGDLALVASLTSTGADYDFRDEFGQSSLHAAAEFGYVAVYEYLSKLVRRDTPVVDALGRTPLHLAASKGAVGVVATIYAESPKSAMLDSLNYLGYSPLLSAAHAGELECLQYLLKFGTDADVFRKTDFGISALHLACQSGSASAVNMLLGRGLDPNARSNDGSTALHYAASIPNDYECAEVIELLLEAHADPGVQRSDRSLPIHLILSTTPPRRPNLPPFHNDKSLAILSKGLSDRRNKNNDTTLHLVCKCITESARFLEPGDTNQILRWIATMVDDGYNPLLENNENESSLQILLIGFERKYLNNPLAAVPSALEIILARLQYCAGTLSLPVEIQKIALRILSSLIEHSRWSHYRRICEQLVALVRDTSDLDPISMTSPLLCACSQPFTQVALLILSKASDLSRHDSDGYTALQTAVIQDELSWVKALVRRGANVDQRAANERLETPLMLAQTATDTGKRIAQYLIASGADISLRASNGCSPIHQICLDGALEVLDLVSREEIDAAGQTSLGYLRSKDDDKYQWGRLRCFQLAVVGAHLSMMSFLLEGGFANVNEVTGNNLTAALHIAAYYGHIPVVKYLIKAGADVNCKNALGETPFLLALRAQHCGMLYFLLENGAAVGESNKSLVWMEAFGWNNVELRQLCERAFTRSFGKQCISLSRVLDNHNYTTDVAAAQRTLGEGLRYAIELGNDELSAAILDRGVSIDSPADDCGECGPLLYALRLDRSLIASQLIEAGARLDVTACRQHETFSFDPATYAAWRGNRWLLALILSRGYICTALVHPIHVAIAMDHEDCVEVILDYSSRQIQETTAMFSHTNSIIESPTPTTRPGPTLGSSKHNDCNPDLSTLLVDQPEASSERYWRSLTLAYPIQANLSSWPWISMGYKEGSCPEIGWTALHLAVRDHREAIVHILLQYGADMEARDGSGSTPLHVAAGNGNLVIVNILLGRGASQIVQTTAGETPLFKASAAGHFKVAERLLNSETVNIADENGWSPLHMFPQSTRQKKCVNAIAKMLDIGADIEAASSGGTRVLHVAAEEKKLPETLRLLLDRGANFNARDSDGRTAIFYAAKCGSLQGCQDLVRHGASVDIVDNDRENLLHVAIGEGFFDVAQWLIEVQPSLVSARTPYGCTPLHFALSSDDVKTHRWALDQSADYNLECLDFCGSYLHDACRFGRREVAQEIIQTLSREELHALCRKTSQVITPPLTLAVMAGHIAIIQLLLDAGAPLDVSHPPWVDPLTEAVRQHRHDIARLLLVRTFEDMHRNLEETEISGEDDKSSKEDGASREDSLSKKGDLSTKDAWVKARLKELFEKAAGGTS